MSLLKDLVEYVEKDFDRKSLESEYRSDPAKWCKDALGMHLWSKQREVAESVRDNPRTAVRSSNGIGKALWVETPLPTPDGWTTMGEVQPGEYVYDELGNPVKVLSKSNVFYKDTYRVTFSDGAEIIASGDHLWSTVDFRSAQRGPRIKDYRDEWDRSEVRTTKELSETLFNNCGQRNHRVAVNGALQAPKKSLPVAPYVLGVWLGDGTASDTAVTLGDSKKFIIGEFAKFGVALMPSKSTPLRFTFAFQGYRDKLRELNVYRNKHIPQEYLRASESQRRELLRGIMDTDGFVCGMGVCGIDLMDEELAFGVVELVRSLGIRMSITPGRTYLNGRDVGTRYRMVFNPLYNPFTPNSEKGLRWAPTLVQQARKTVRTIVSVDKIDTLPTQCISVDSPRKLYLAGEHMIPTHNTECAAALTLWFLYMNLRENPKETIVVVTAPAFPQIKTNMFAALSRLKEKAAENGFEIPGRIVSSGNTAAWKLEDGTEVVLGRRPPDGSVIQGFQGIHRAHTLVVIDEAGGVPRELIDLAARITTGGDFRILAIGNPDTVGSEFYRMFGEDSAWNKIHISTFDTPNFTGEPVPADLASKLVSKAYEEYALKAWGKDDPRYQISILGEFPDTSDVLFFPQTLIDQGVRAEIEDYASEPIRLGVDLAMHGEDSTVIYSYQGGRLRLVDHWPKATAMENATKVHRWALELGAQRVQIDAGGIGLPIIEIIADFPDVRYDIVELNGATSSTDKRRWLNSRAEWYDHMRTLLMTDSLDLSDDDTQLQDEMRDINGEIKDNGQLKIESKRDLRARTGRSPDFLDAAVYACMDIDKFRELTQKAQKSTEYENPSSLFGDEVPRYLGLLVQNVLK